MGEELHKYKVYITTVITTVVSLIISLSGQDFPEYLIPPCALFITLALCRLVSHFQLESEKKQAKNISDDILSKATQIHAIISASAQDKSNDFEKSKKTIDEILSNHMTEMMEGYNDQKKKIKRLEAQKERISDEMFDAVKSIDSNSANGVDRI